MKTAGAAIDSDGLGDTCVRSDGFLEGAHLGADAEGWCPQDGKDGIDVVLVDGRLGKRDLHADLNAHLGAHSRFCS